MPANRRQHLKADNSHDEHKNVSIFSSTYTQGRRLLIAANRQSGQKRRFGAAGVINVLLTNIVLQVLLASSLASVTVATLISQLINSCLGYAIYGKVVFQAKRLKHHRRLIRYLLLMIGIWVLNTGGIEAGEALGLNRNLSAAALVPILAVVSFTLQKYWVFE